MPTNPEDETAPTHASGFYPSTIESVDPQRIAAVDLPEGFWDDNRDAMWRAFAASRHRYAMKVKGFDPDGRPHCLVLTWEGVWHPASPTTGNLLLRADAPDQSQHAIVNGVVSEMLGQSIRATVMGSRPGSVLFCAVDNPNEKVRIDPETIVEVLP